MACGLDQLHDVAFRVEAVAAEEEAELPGPAWVQLASQPGDQGPEALDVRDTERELDRVRSRRTEGTDIWMAAASGAAISDRVHAPDRRTQ
jgi:hypothetical protein